MLSKASTAMSIALTAVLVTAFVSTSEAGAKASKSKSQSNHKAGKDQDKSKATARDDEEGAIRRQISSLSNALTAGDAKTVLSLFTDDGVYISDEGSEFKGKPALEERFGQVFSESGKQKVELVPHTLRLLSDKVGLAEGFVFRKDQGIRPVPETRFSFVLLKRSGEWLISNAVETPFVAQANTDPLQSLSWIIGEWSAEKNGGFVHMTAEWAANKNFIVCQYETKKTAQAKPVESRQVIGWDPRSDRPISWSFDANGGFGWGNWNKDDKQWRIEATGVERDGSTAVSTNVLTIKDQNSFLW